MSFQTLLDPPIANICLLSLALAVQCRSCRPEDLFAHHDSVRLKKFDQSAASSRKGSQAPTPPRSVVGIGNKGNPFSIIFHADDLREYTVAKPDYSEAKIVLAMVRIYKALM